MLLLKRQHACPRQLSGAALSVWGGALPRVEVCGAVAAPGRRAWGQRLSVRAEVLELVALHLPAVDLGAVRQGHRAFVPA